MNEAVITIKLTDSEVNLMVETLKNSTLNGEMKEPLKRLEDDLVDILDMVALKPLQRLEDDLVAILDMVALKRRENKLMESREVTIG